MDGLDLDDENDDTSFSRDTRRTSSSNMENGGRSTDNGPSNHLQYDTGKKGEKLSFSHTPPSSREEALLQELKVAREALHEKDYRLQRLEEANNRLLFRMRNLSVEIQGKEKTISELNQEITFMKRKLDKPTEILVNEIKQKDLIIESLRRRQQQNRSVSIPIDGENERFSQSSLGSYMQSFAHQQSASQYSGYGGHRRIVRQNRACVQDETEIINEWNKTLQVFDITDPSFILHLRQYVILSISRLAMLGQSVSDSDEGIYGQCCYMCGRKFDCLHKPIVCVFCRFMFCANCAPRTLVLGVNNISKRVCVLCEHMYKFVNKKDEKQYS